MLEPLPALAAVHGRYDALLCDLWGVVHNGREAFAPALAALSAFRAQGGRVVLISNVPKPRDPIPGQLDRLGVPRDAWDVIVTSGDAIRAELAARAPGPMLRIGPAHDGALWEGLGLAEADLAQARFLAVSGLTDDARETPEDYHPLLQAAAARNLEMLCANPDILVRVGDRLVWCAGALARDYGAMGGPVVMAGKPHPPIYDLAYRELPGIEKSRMLAIGDGIGTDVQGAADQGLDCLFIASGMHGEALMSAGRLDPAKAAAALAEGGVSARYIAAALA